MRMKQLWELLKLDVRRIGFILAHPRENPREFLFLVGLIIVLLFLILTIVALFFVEPSKKEAAKEKEAARKKIFPKISRLNLGIFLLTIFFLIIISGSVYTSSPSFCSSCHEMKSYYKSWQKSSHKEVPCLRCHGEPSWTGLFINKIKLGQEAIRYTTGSYQKPITSRLKDISCLSCHRERMEKTVIGRAVRVSHRELLKSRYKCTDCHSTVAHGTEVSIKKYPSEDKCTSCHNGKKASARCKLCHIKKEVARLANINDYPKVHIMRGLKAPCRNCHTNIPCEKCHGDKPIHPLFPSFAYGGHEREARRGCWRCHDKQFCSSCHNYPTLVPIPGPPLDPRLIPALPKGKFDLR